MSQLTPMDFAQTFATWLTRQWTESTVSLTYLPPRDPVFDAAAAIIYDRKVAKFEEFIKNVEIWHPSHPVPVGVASSAGVKLYMIKQLFDMPRIVPLRLIPDTKHPWVEVRTGGRWMFLGDYLDQLNLSSLSRFVMEKLMSKEEGYIQLSKWWNFQGSKAPRLLDLPRELRNLIYGFVRCPEACLEFGSSNEELWVRSAMLLSAKYLVRAADSQELHPLKDLTFLPINRQIYQEGTAETWKKPNFCFKRVEPFALFCQLVPVTKLCLLRSLEMQCDFGDFTRLFKVECLRGIYEGDYERNEFDEAAVFQYLNLSQLQLTMPSVHNPRTSLYYIHHLIIKIEALESQVLSAHAESDALQFSRDHDGRYQDWKFDAILHSALPYIQHIPRIILAGGISDATKAKWTEILDNRRAA